jgi:pimeloyl-ACP methyl ester carboxylesterase
MTQPRHVASGHASLATWREGRGDPVVFLHAGVADSRMWEPQRREVSKGHCAIAYDRRGFGETRTTLEDFSSVGDLLAVLNDAAPERRAVLVGCSQGGKVAIDAALTHPDRVRALVLIAPSVSGAPRAEHPPEIARLLRELHQAEEAGNLDAVNLMEARLWLDGPLAPVGRVGGEARSLFLAMNGIALRAGDLGTDTDTVGAYDRLGEVLAPALVIYGDLDFPHIQARCRLMGQTLPRAKVHQLAGVAHLPSLERPEAVGGIVAEFIGGLS